MLVIDVVRYVDLGKLVRLTKSADAEDNLGQVLTAVMEEVTLNYVRDLTTNSNRLRGDGFIIEPTIRAYDALRKLDSLGMIKSDKSWRYICNYASGLRFDFSELKYVLEQLDYLYKSDVVVTPADPRPSGVLYASRKKE